MSFCCRSSLPSRLHQSKKVKTKIARILFRPLDSFVVERRWFTAMEGIFEAVNDGWFEETFGVVPLKALKADS